MNINSEKNSNGARKLLKPYNSAETEDRIYKLWEESGFFNPDGLPCVALAKQGKIPPPKTFSMVLPPPNVTGVLHMGHALTIAIEDIMVRFHRMRGYKTLWIPGTDHAAIATQSRVETEIYKKEGKRRQDLGREELLRRIEEFAKQSHDTIVNQTKKMGASLDWSREAFTLDEKRSLAVRTAFKKMYDQGLIYRGQRVINWDPKGQTTISDDEIVYEERKTKFYTFRYSKDFPISIATTRPETKLGDTAVAVNPNDQRYKKYIGQEYDVDFVGVKLHIKIIADQSVDPEFGTGALGVTPAHSVIDSEIAQRHNLPMIQVINEYARMMVPNPLLKDKKVSEAREIIVETLRKEGLLEKEEEIIHNIALAERTGGVVEPLPKLQWFVNVNKPIKERKNKTLKDLMREPVENSEIEIIPDHFKKTYFHWIDNLRDWCISRQIWYGHRLPVYYCKQAGISNFQFPISKQNQKLKIKSFPPEADPPSAEKLECQPIISIEPIKKCPDCGNELEQDPDTLDTWFSSALWTFFTLGYPEKTKDLETFHPTSVLETGYEILFFWVARMIMMSGFFLGEIPFRTVYLHGTIRDSKGKKMSKSLGNAIDPLDMTAKYGTDAVRMSLVVGTAPGTDSKVDENKIKAYRHFANKIWNISRFVLLQKNAEHTRNDEIILTEEDKTLLDEFSSLAKDITKDIEEFRFYLAGEKIYHYVWHRFADIILEESKGIFAKGSAAEQNSRKWALFKILEDSLKILHPFMPFVTEEIWQLMGKTNLLMVEKWPEQAR